jgi:hypothetical protein
VRHARSIFSAVCLLLCVAVVALWVRGYFVSDTVGFGRRRPGDKGWAVGAMHGRGGAGVALVTGIDSNSGVHGFFHDRQPPRYSGELDSTPAVFQALGFSWISIAPPSVPVRGWAVAVPLWFLLLLLMAWPAWHFRTVRRAGPERRRRLGLCVRCGYDLRASAERCPECGQEIPSSAAISQSPSRLTS